MFDKSSELTPKTSEPFQKTGDGFLPDINQRPGSRKKVTLPSKNSFNMTSFDSVKGERPASKNKDLGSTGVNLFKSESIKEKDVKLSQPSNSSKAIEGLAKTTTGGRMIVKRGLSKGRK